MNNSTQPQLDKVADNDAYRVSPVLTSIGTVVVIYIVIANSILIVCFIVNRNRVWNAFTRQVFNLAISDLFVGLSGVPILITSNLGIVTPHGICAIAYYLFIAAQSGSLFNVLAICLQRALMLKNRLPSANSYNATRNIFILVGAWTASLLICGVPFVSWSTSGGYNNICVITTIFGNDFERAMRLLSLSYLIPFVFTDVLYACACFRLANIWSRTIFPASSSTNIITVSPANPADKSQDVCNSVVLRTSLRRQRQVFGTIGILLLLLNLFTVPIILMFLCSQGGYDWSRNVKWFASITFMFNSAFNPVVYAVRIKSLNDGLRRMFQNCCSVVTD